MTPSRSSKQAGDPGAKPGFGVLELPVAYARLIYDLPPDLSPAMTWRIPYRSSAHRQQIEWQLFAARVELEMEDVEL